MKSKGCKESKIRNDASFLRHVSSFINRLHLKMDKGSRVDSFDSFLRNDRNDGMFKNQQNFRTNTHNKFKTFRERGNEVASRLVNELGRRQLRKIVKITACVGMKFPRTDRDAISRLK